MAVFGAYLLVLIVAFLIESTVNGTAFAVCFFIGAPVAAMVALGISAHFWIFGSRFWKSLSGRTWADPEADKDHSGIAGAFTAFAYFVVCGLMHLFFGGVFVTFAIAGVFVVLNWRGQLL